MDLNSLLLGFTGFYRVSTGFPRVSISFHGFLMDFHVSIFFGVQTVLPTAAENHCDAINLIASSSFFF